MTIRGLRASLVLVDDEPVDPVRFGDACAELVAGFSRLSESFAALAAGLTAAAEQRRAQREWLEQHARAVAGDGDAVLYLLRTPRPQAR